jgi:hypothetical protein
MSDIQLDINKTFLRIRYFPDFRINHLPVCPTDIFQKVFDAFADATYYMIFHMKNVACVVTSFVGRGRGVLKKEDNEI